MITHAQVRSLPRIRGSKINLVKEAYEIWYEKYKYKYTYKQFEDIWKLIYQDLYECVGEERDGVKLPHCLGEFYIGTIPTSLKLKKTHFHKIQNYNPEFRPYDKIYKEFIKEYPNRYKISQEKKRGNVTNINKFFKLFEITKELKSQLDSLKYNLNIYK